jgi:hypothetical protein
MNAKETSALKSNPQITSFLKRTQSDSVGESESPSAKRSRLGDPAITLTASELRAATKDELIAHIVAIQKQVQKAAD